MSYQNDIFFSYKRDPQTDDWYHQVEAKIRLWVGLELGYEPKIWVDRRSIQAGTKHTPEIRSALKQSRVMVSFWSPLYFRSLWCMTEWKTFLHRGEKYATPLVLPASVHDGDTFPDEARDTQYHKFNDFFKSCPIFWKEQGALQFEDQLKAFSMRLAQMIMQSPPFEDFDVIEAGASDLQPVPPIGRIADV
jgi:hypothetical protein